MKAAVIIPARYASTRFPAKLLAPDPAGKPLIQHTWEAAQRAERVERVVVATDDERIADAVRAFGGEACMTAAEHACGSDRCAEVARDLDHDVIVNLQGDEPNLPADLIHQTLALLEADAEAAIATLATRITEPAEYEDPSVVKVVLGEKSRALYFSRWAVPYVRGAEDPLSQSPVPHLRHHGIYAFRRPALLDFARLGPHPLEQAESLEQLRALAHGYIISVGITTHRTLKVDTPEDYAAFFKAIQSREGRDNKG